HTPKNRYISPILFLKKQKADKFWILTCNPFSFSFFFQYGIVLDAGSSRTTVYVYQWPAEKENDTGVVSQTFKCSVKGLGISSYGNNPQEIVKPIDDCMNKVKEKIPSHLHKNTPTYLGATAGMRLLRLQNETAANEVLGSIQNYFRSQPFEFRGAQIITGQEEGVYGWITANYLMGNFLEKTLWRRWVHPHGAETMGALDLGGASTQLSFVPEECMQNSNSTLQVQLYGYEYSVYTHSFQCYGRDEAEKRLLASLVQTKVDNPCYPQNYETVLTMKSLYGSLCTESLRPTNYNPGQLINFKGTGDPALCREKVSLLFNFTACNDKGEDCSFNGVYQPKLKGKFVAFSGFYYTANALNLTGCFPLADFNSSMWFFCSQNWNQVSMNFLHLERGKIKDIAWSLGYMLNLTNMIPAESHLIQLPVNPFLFAGLLFFFTAVALLCLIFVVYLCVVSCMRKNINHMDHVLATE
uniref:Ectonucleoside triphosphate diphosphohydrolase 3 n=1 Tax=Gopherus evgoodei TaxID=1825980 RepID=A0A8C4YQC0_9SAUR